MVVMDQYIGINAPLECTLSLKLSTDIVPQRRDKSFTSSQADLRPRCHFGRVDGTV
jgi:hypothetical protein